MKSHAINLEDPTMAGGFSITEEELQNAYEYAKAKVALKYNLRKMHAKTVKRYIGLQQDESLIYHVVNGTASSRHVLHELLKFIFHVDPDLLPEKVILELKEKGEIDDLDDEYPHPDFINNININGNGE